MGTGPHSEKGSSEWRKIFRKAAGSRTFKSSKVRTVHTVARVILENKGQILSLLSKPSNGFLLHSVVLTRNVPVLGILLAVLCLEGSSPSKGTASSLISFRITSKATLPQPPYLKF